MEGSEQSGSGKWKKRVALIFLFVFAMVWSLGPFFFWVPLALSAYFGFLSLVSSGSVGQFFSSIQNSFSAASRPQPATPYQSFHQRPPVAEDGQIVLKRVLKIIRIIGLIIFGFVVFFFFVGIFVGNNPEIETESIAVTETIADNGADLWNDKGNAALAKPDYDSAFYYYNQALAIDPQNTYALYNKGLTYTLQQDYRRGNGFARACLRYHPDYNPAWWLLGYNYDLLNNPDSALYCLEKAYLNDYSQPEFLQLMAEVYVKKDRRSNALEAYRKLISVDTTKADIYRKLAELDPSNAEEYRRKANALEKGN